MLKKAFLGCVALWLCVAAPSSALQLGGRTAEEWKTVLDASGRVQGLRIAEVARRLQLQPGQIVADIGAGTGLFSLGFSRLVRPGGRVYAVEVDEELVEHIVTAATEQGIVNVEGVFGEFDDPLLPAAVDVAFIHDVLHHIEHRDVYLRNLARYLKPSGRVAIIDFKPGQGGHTGDPAMQVSQEQATMWMAAAGLKPVEAIEGLFPDKWFVIYAR